MLSESDLGDLVREHADRHAIPGVTIGLSQDGVVSIAHHGVADVRTSVPVQAGTRFAAGSLTKTMVATVIARLAADGRLSLEDPVAAHVPEVRGRAWTRRSTVRDLLANRSGLPLRADLEFGFDRHLDADDLALSRLATEVAAAVPIGTFWSYSNIGWCLLGRVIETVTGQTWDAAMRHHLFEPAGMRETTIGSAEPRATGHTIVDRHPEAVAGRNARAYAPAGTSLMTTAADLLRFAELHMTNPGLAVLRVAHADISIPSWFDAWCLGQARFDWGRPVWGWDGMIDGQRSVLRYAPERHVAIALMTNGSTGRAMFRSLLPELMGSFGIAVPPLRPDTTPLAAERLDRFAGRYRWPDWDIRVAAGPTELTIETPEQRVTASPIGAGTFRVDPPDPDSPTVMFSRFDRDGRPHLLYDALWGFPRRAA